MRALSFRRGRTPLVAVFLTAALAQPAQAQLGGLMRRAAERRIEQTVDDKANIAMLVAPTFDNTTLEITSERLDRYQAAAEKKRAQAAQARAASEALRERANATYDSASRIRNQREEDAYERAVSRYRECRRDVVKGLETESEKRMQAFVTQVQTNPVAAQRDPKAKEYIALMQEVGAAQGRNDPAASQRAIEKLQAFFGQVTDSAAIDRAAVGKCGARPTKPASMVRYEELSARAESLQQQANELETAANRVKGTEMGMTDGQASMLEERILSWLAGMRQDAPITRTFTRPEYDLLVSHRSALKKILRGS